MLLEPLGLENGALGLEIGDRKFDDRGGPCYPVPVFVPWGGSPLTKRGENACGPKLFPYSPGPSQV